MRPPQRRGAALGESDVVEQAILYVAVQRADDLFNGDVWVHTRTLVQIDAFRSAQGRVDSVDATSEVCGAELWCRLCIVDFSAE